MVNRYMPCKQEMWHNSTVHYTMWPKVHMHVQRCPIRSSACQHRFMNWTLLQFWCLLPTIAARYINYKNISLKCNCFVDLGSTAFLDIGNTIYCVTEIL